MRRMGTRQSQVLAVVGLLLGCSLATVAMVGGATLLKTTLIGIGWLLAGVLPLLYLVFVWILLSAIPRDPQLTPVLDPKLPDDLAELEAEFAAAGFERVGGLFLLNTQPRTTTLNFVHPGLGAYATAQKVWRSAPVWGLITPRADRPGNLETLATIEVDALPAVDGTRRQILEGADVATLARHHGDALESLRARGVAFSDVSGPWLERELCASNLRQRELIHARPFRTATVFLWRTLTGRFPSVGPLVSRAEAT
ncbi:MAG: hypothetical protein ACYTGN_03665 [Planctomycetota bacterium]|jgi:hypothetical protein